MNHLGRRVLAAALATTGLGITVSALVPRAAMTDYSLTAGASATSLGSLAITPTPGLDTSRSMFTTVSTAAAKGCPAGTAYVQATGTGPGSWSTGLLVIGTTDQDFSTANDFSIGMSDTWAGIASSNSASITAGTYAVRLSCIDTTTTVTYGVFDGSVVFSTPKNYSAGPASTPSPTASPTASPSATPTASATATPTPTGTPSATATPTATATASPTRSASPTPTASGSPTASASATPTATATATPSATASGTPASTSGPTAGPSSGPTPTASPSSPLPRSVVAYDGSGATLSSTPTLTPGQQVRVVGSGFLPRAPITATVYSTPRRLGATTADSKGIISYPFTVPADLAAGQHRLVLRSSTSSVTLPFTVRRDTTGGPTGAGPAAVGGKGGALPFTGFGLGPTLAVGLGLIGAGVALVTGTRPAPAGPRVAEGRHVRP